ncbi:MAG TPA: hypothetical protein VNH65_03235 [Candidatus Acidoferrum sp.]|nr:hypothetical protein [Candidatus Acidoferrum sp.]
MQRVQAGAGQAPGDRTQAWNGDNRRAARITNENGADAKQGRVAAADTMAQAEEGGFMGASEIKSFTVEIVEGRDDATFFRLKEEFHVGLPYRQTFNGDSAEFLAWRLCGLLGVRWPGERIEEQDSLQVATAGRREETFTRPLRTAQGD